MALRPWLLGMLSLLVLSPDARAGDALRIDDPRPRWVSVHFQPSSPWHRRRTEVVPVPAWLEPERRDPRRIAVTIPAVAVEGALMAGQRPVPGSFSDFVWVFDAETGHVISAELSGAVRRRIGAGFLSTDVVAEIQVNLDTRHVAGFRPRHLLGMRLVGYCTPEQPDCTPVAPRAFDPLRGHVNAVGALVVRAGGLTTQVFSGLGRAVFLERQTALPAAERVR